MAKAQNKARRVFGALSRKNRINSVTAVGGHAPSRKPKLKLGRKTVTEGYAFVVQNTADEWFFVNFEYSTTLGLTRALNDVYPAITEEMREFWKRVVIDDAYEWDHSHVNRKTMRLVKVKVESHDCTLDLFRDESDMRESQRMAALSKLTDEEAKALRVDKQHTIMKMFRDKSTDGINHLSSELRDQLRTMDVCHITGLPKN